MADSRGERPLATSIFVMLGLVGLFAPIRAAPASMPDRNDLGAARQAYAQASAGSTERQDAAIKLGVLLLRRATNLPNGKDGTPAPDQAGPSAPPATSALSAREELTEAETLFREVVAAGGRKVDEGEAGLIATMLARGAAGAPEANGEIQRLRQSGRSADAVLCMAMTDLLTGTHDRQIAMVAGDLLNEHIHALVPTAPYVASTRVSKPERLSTPPPRYSEEARVHKLRGNVIFQIVVDRGGQVADLLILKPGPFSLNEPAAKTLRRWTFRPALLDGKPVPVCEIIGVGFDVM